MKKQSTAELAALLSKELADRPKRRARVLDLDGPDDEQDEPATGQPVLSQPAVSQPNAGQPIEPTPAGPVSHPAVSQPAASLLATAPDSAGFSKIPNRYFDHLCAHLTPDEQAVYSQLYRLSHGYGKETCLVSNSRLSERSSVPLSTLKRAVTRLVGRGLVEKVNAVHGPSREQGVTYRVPAASQLTVGQPKTGQPVAGHNKRTIKDNSKMVTVCDRCKDHPGIYYPDGIGNGPVKKCDHGAGD